MSNKKGMFLKVILILTTIFIASVIIGGTYFYLGLSRLSENSVDIQNNTADMEDINKIDTDDTKESINILALGVDIGTPGSEEENDPKRTDTMILIHYDKINKTVSIISIPRDTLIKINGRNTKINAAHAIGGVQYSVSAVENLLGVRIDYYGKLNYEGFREIIDSIGGITMEIEYDMDYDDPAQDLHIHFKKGERVHLDGEKAEHFFRWRKNNNGSGLAEGDIGRIKNQQIFMSKLVEKVKSPRIIPRIPGILMTMPRYVETNMSGDEILKYGYAFIRANEINMETLKGNTKYIRGLSYFIYDERNNKGIVNKLNNVVGNKVGIEKEKVKIEVLNGTGETGLAAKYREYLKSKGYSNISTGNTNYTETTKIQLNEDFNRKQVKYIEEEFLIDKSEGENNESFDIIIILGKDYKDYLE